MTENLQATKGLTKMSEPLTVRQPMSKKFCTIVIYIKKQNLTTACDMP